MFYAIGPRVYYLWGARQLPHLGHNACMPYSSALVPLECISTIFILREAGRLDLTTLVQHIIAIPYHRDYIMRCRQDKHSFLLPRSCWKQLHLFWGHGMHSHVTSKVHSGKVTIVILQDVWTRFSGYHKCNQKNMLYWTPIWRNLPYPKGKYPLTLEGFSRCV